MIEYCILRADDPSDLESAVKTHLADGWDVVGGVSIGEYTVGPYEDRSVEVVWAQAVIRRPRPEPG